MTLLAGCNAVEKLTCRTIDRFVDGSSITIRAAGSGDTDASTIHFLLQLTGIRVTAGLDLCAMNPSHTCGVCGVATDIPTHRVMEWLYATGETFPYFQCPECGCLQLAEVPRDMSRYYPADYYSFNSSCDGNAETWIIRRRMAGKGGGWRAKKMLLLEGWEPYEWLSPALCGFDSRILDIGCGDGGLLRRMHAAGFARLTGIDPFMHNHSAGERDGVRLLKEDIFHHQGTYDLIMMNHSFEHMTEEPGRVIERVASMLDKGGRLLIGIPVCDSWAWERLKERWVNIDAPRHIFLHTRDSIGRLAVAAGLCVERVGHNSITAQFALSTPTQGATLRLRWPGTERWIPGTRWVKRWLGVPLVWWLNRTGRGDRAWFILKKATA